MTRILSLDNNPGGGGRIIVDWLRRILEDAGYESLTATDEQEALCIMRRQPVDLLTQNLTTEVLLQRRSDETLRHIPVLLVSGSPRNVCAEMLQHYGLDMDRDVDGHVHKPAGPELLDAVETILVKYGKPLPPEELRLRARERLRKCK